MDGEAKELMIVSGIKCPPRENKRKVFYQGPPISISNIPERLGFDEDSKNYLYTVNIIKRTGDVLSVSSQPCIYDGYFELDDFHGRKGNISIPFDSGSKEGLLKFLEGL
jgi:hypothetical protein